MKWLKANALCLVCGTTEEHPVTGYCKNDHDNWLEEKDTLDRFQEAVRRFKTTLEKVGEAISSNSNNLENTVVL